MTKTIQGKFHFATDDHVKKNGIFYVPFSQLAIEKDFNDRTDYGTGEEMSELMQSIYEVGVRVPLRGYKDGDKYVVTVGHRRFKAGEMIMKQYKKEVLFPIVMYPPGTEPKDMLLDTLLTNSGKDLTPLEKASTVSRLIDLKATPKEIASSLGGVSEVYIKNLQKLWTIPDNAKKLIRDGVVSATLIMGVLKNKNANLEDFIAEVQKQAEIEGKKKTQKKGTKKKTAKVTAKNVKSGKTDSLKEFKRFRKEAPDTFKSKDKQAAFEFVCQLQDNKLSYTDILDFFTVK